MEAAPSSSPERKRRRGPDWVVQFEGQMLVCGFLAKALYGSPDRDWLAGLVQGGLFDAVPFGGDLAEIVRALDHLRRWASVVGPGLDQQAFIDLRDDHMRLFVGPGRLPSPPWESAYINKDRALFQMQTVGVKNWYRRFDLVLASDYNEPADHVGLQFAFLGHLAESTIAAAAISDGGEVKRLIDAQRGFLAQHVAPWVPRWADDVAAHARSDFHRGIAWLARGVVHEAASFFAVGGARAATSGPFRIGESSQN